MIDKFLWYIHCRYMNTTLQMWGNSLALRIPQAIAKQIQIGRGDDVELRVAANELRIRPARQRYRVSKLIGKITPANRHNEISWGKSVGKEF
jgi:antitoxin MazE